MPHTTHRRAFIAATALAVPTLAAARVSAASLTTRDDDSTDFQDHMKATYDALYELREPMRTPEDDTSRASAAMHANSAAIHLAYCVRHADQAAIPRRSRDQYAVDPARFTKDLRLELTRSVSAANALSRQLLLGNVEESVNLYRDLRALGDTGHDQFQEED